MSRLSSCCRAPPPPLLTAVRGASSSSRVRVCSSGETSLWGSDCYVGFDQERSFVKRWRLRHVLCYKSREEESSSETDHDSNFKLTESQTNNQFAIPQDNKKHWFSTICEVVSRTFSLPNKSWSVPWTSETILQVMFLWIASFWFVGSWIVPFLAQSAGFTKQTLTHRGQALYSLITDLAEGIIGILILHRSLSKFKPLPPDWFNFKFSLKSNWHLHVLIACLLFPFVNFLSQINLTFVPPVPALPTVPISSVEQSIFARDPIAMGIYAIVVVICAPIWEEILFRGFLLPSLTKYMSVNKAVLVSSICFAFAHFNLQRILPLVFLGVVMGGVYVKSRNLVASMVLHGLWNGFVFLDLMK
ncbi:hypothetical protein LUZ60_012556 [Juncus effusus]|nr:hypothetical protein LUZ60_012556 [Juncus effusus]